MTTTPNYSLHRLNREEDLKPYYTKTITTKGGAVTFWQYAERLYKKMVMMVPGETLPIEDLVDEDNRDVFIKLVCAFMMSGIAQGFWFNTTYTQLRRASAPILATEENILKPVRL